MMTAVTERTAVEEQGGEERRRGMGGDEVGCEVRRLSEGVRLGWGSKDVEGA